MKTSKRKKEVYIHTGPSLLVLVETLGSQGLSTPSHWESPYQADGKHGLTQRLSLWKGQCCAVNAGPSAARGGTPA